MHLFMDEHIRITQEHIAPEQLYIKINALLLSVYPRYKTAHLINAFGITFNLYLIAWQKKALNKQGFYY